VNGKVKFKIVDAASLEILARGSRAPAYNEITLVRIRNTSEGPKFSGNRVPKAIKEQFVDFMTR
jgi:hypothetical protein